MPKTDDEIRQRGRSRADLGLAHLDEMQLGSSSRGSGRKLSAAL